MERVLGAVAHGLAWPSITLIYFVLLCVAGDPIVITDVVPAKDGRTIKSLRFPTTGADKPGFRDVGRFLRKYALDELPALWSLTRGDVRLRDVFPELFG